MRKIDQSESHGCFSGAVEKVRALADEHAPLVLGISMLFLWGAWAIFFAPFGISIFCGDADIDCKRLEKLGQIGDLFGGINALFAALAFVGVAVSTDLARRAYKEDKQKSRDEVYVKQVQTSYEWAYSAFSSGGEPPPRGSGEEWLTAARHLLRARSIGDLVETDAYRLILAEHKEFWRRQFLKTLQKMDGSPEMVLVTYFGDHIPVGNHFSRGSHFDLTAAKVIIDFSQWDDEVQDPIDLVDDHLELKNCFNGRVGRGLKTHLDMVEEVREAERLRQERAVENRTE